MARRVKARAPRKRDGRRKAETPGARDRPTLVGASLKLGDEVVPLRSGAMHYWRLPPDQWGDALRNVRDLGLPLVDTYVPWGVHETAAGKFDFGERDPRLDLCRFLNLAQENDLRVLLRPGPHINAELTYFGLPERIVRDPDCQARSPRGNPVVLFFPPKMFPVPSHASEAYHEEVGRWYDAVAEVVVPFVWPHGPIVLLQVDNEAGFFFRNGPFCQDYHDDAVAAWHTFLQERHGQVDAVAQAHQCEYTGWSNVEPPRSFTPSSSGSGSGTDSPLTDRGNLARQLDWAEFHEQLLSTAIGRMRRRMAKTGLIAPTIHNVSLGDGGLPVSVPGLETEVDLVGLDYYHPAREHPIIKRRTLYLAGTVKTPYAPELGIGAPPWFTPLSHDDSLYCAMAATAFGLRGFNLYMVVDRDRWYGAAIDSQGQPRKEAASWRAFLHALSAVDFESLQREVRVALLIPKEYQRLSRATHLLGPVSPSTLEAMGGSPVDGCRTDTLGFADPIQLQWWDVVSRMAAALDVARVPYVYLDSEALQEQWSYDVIFAPSFEFASRARWEKLNEAVRNGTHVVYGPHLPTLDDRMQRHGFEPLGSAPVQVADDHASHALVHDWIDRFDLKRPYPAQPPIETTVHHRDGLDTVLFVMNPDTHAQTAEIGIPRPIQVEDLISQETFEGEQSLRIPMRSHHCRMLRIQGNNP